MPNAPCLVVNNDPVLLNDAEILGREPPAFEALMERDATFLTGELWGQRDRRNTQDGEWQAVTMPLEHWIAGGPREGASPAWGFSRHPEAKRKEGSAIVLGSSVGGARKAKAMDTMYAMGLDIDSGITYADMVDKLIALERFALIYTTFSHGKTGLELKRDEVLRKLDLARDPTDEEVRTYLRRFDKNRYEESFIEAAAIREQKHQTSEGVKIVLDTPELDKMRVIFPLAEPVKLIDLADTQSESLRLWEDKVTGLARNVLGVHFDTSATDPSRLFFLPRHAKDGMWDCAIVRGDPLSFEDIPDMEKAAYTRERIPGGSSVRHFTNAGVDLKSWYVEHAERFQIAELLETLCPDKVRGPASSVTGIVIECPFEAGHSSEGGSGTIAINALDAHGERGTIKCSHDSCQARKNAEYLAEMIAQGWFSEEDLFDKDAGFLLEPGEEVKTCPDIPNEFEPIKNWLPNGHKVRGETIYLAGEERDTPLCQLFNVVGRNANEDAASGAGVIINFTNRNGEKVTVTLDRREIMKDGGGEIIDILADADMLIYVRDRKGKGQLLDLFHQIAPKRLIKTIKRPGWVRDRSGAITGFLCPTGEFIGVGRASQRLLHANATVKDTQPLGTMEGWQEAASAATANFYWAVGVVAGFVGPVMGLLGMRPCGLYFTGASSMGKTSASHLAVSVFTSPQAKRGTFFSMNTTANAVEDLAVMGSETVLGLDELGSMQRPSDLAAMLFGLESGVSKSRKRGYGPEDVEFAPFTILTYERGLREFITASGATYNDGLSVRFPTINVSDGEKVSDTVFAKVESCHKHFGHAGPAFVRWLIAQGHVAQPARLKERHSELVSKIAGDHAGQQLRRAAQVFALVALSGQLAKEAGLIAFDALPHVKEAFATFRATDEARAFTGGGGAVDGFRAFLSTQLGVGIVQAEDAEAERNRPVIGWQTETHFVLNWEALADPRKYSMSCTRTELVKALKEIGAVDLQGKNSYWADLPEDVALGSRKLNNLRVRRDRLEF